MTSPPSAVRPWVERLEDTLARLWRVYAAGGSIVNRLP